MVYVFQITSEHLCLIFMRLNTIQYTNMYTLLNKNIIEFNKNTYTIQYENCIV